MEKVDVAIQSYKKPESMIYTLFSLQKYCGDIIDTVYINDDCSNDGTVDYYLDGELQRRLAPIKIKVRVNDKPSKYTYTLMTKDLYKRKTFVQKLQLQGHKLIKRLRWMPTEDDIRYQWAINQTDKKYLFIIHDDIKFFDNILKLYISVMDKDNNLAIVGDLGGSKRCPFGPCGVTDKCSPKKIMAGEYPCDRWPITGRHSFFHTMLGRYKRNCRINEWCCLINVNIAKELAQKYGICFGNYEGGGDVGTYWFDKIIKLGYKFSDPVPDFEERKKWYLHWWQGHEGHNVWVDQGNGKAKYERDFIRKCIKEEFGYEVFNYTLSD